MKDKRKTIMINTTYIKEMELESSNISWRNRKRFSYD